MICLGLQESRKKRTKDARVLAQPQDLWKTNVSANQELSYRITQIRVGWGADEVPRSAALFRPPSPKPIVQLSLQWAFQHHRLRETDIGFRLIGLPYVTSWWQVAHNTSVLRFLAAIILTHAGFSRPS